MPGGFFVTWVNAPNLHKLGMLDHLLGLANERKTRGVGFEDQAVQGLKYVDVVW